MGNIICSYTLAPSKLKLEKGVSKVMIKYFSFLLLAIVLHPFTIMAQDKFCQTWFTDGKTSKVQIYLAADGKYYGKIVWLRDGIVNGLPLLDKKNPDATKRATPWLGLQIITGLTKKSETEIVNGKIYDPVHGNYYNCKMTLSGSDKLELRGYILGIPFLGKTTTWSLDTPAEQQVKEKAPAATGNPQKQDKNL